MRIDRHLSEYFLFQTLWTLFRSRFTHRQRRPYAAFETQAILEAWQHLPANVVRPERNNCQHLSSVLSRNEVEREYAYNRALFTRVTQGWYQFNPKLSVRRRRGDEELWVPIYAALIGCAGPNGSPLQSRAQGCRWNNLLLSVAFKLQFAGDRALPISA